MNRIEEFIEDSKSFICFDLSEFKTDDEYTEFIESAKSVIAKYSPESVYTISNMTNAVLSKNTHDIIAGWVAYNKPYVKCGAVYGVDFAMKTIGKTVGIVTQRLNIVYVATKEEAIKYLLNVD